MRQLHPSAFVSHYSKQHIEGHLLTALLRILTAHPVNEAVSPSPGMARRSGTARTHTGLVCTGQPACSTWANTEHQQLLVKEWEGLCGQPHCREETGASVSTTYSQLLLQQHFRSRTGTTGKPRGSQRTVSLGKC